MSGNQDLSISGYLPPAFLSVRTITPLGNPMIDLSGAADLIRLSNGSWVFSGFSNSELAKLQESSFGNQNAEHSASLLSDSDGTLEGFALKAIVSLMHLMLLPQVQVILLRW